MSGAEIPQFSHDANNSSANTPERYENPLTPILIDKIVDFKHRLTEKRPIDVTESSFIFENDKLDGLYIPDAILPLNRKYGKIEEVSVDCFYLKDTPTSFEIEIKLRNDETSDPAYLMIDRPYNYYHTEKHDYDYVYADNDR